MTNHRRIDNMSKLIKQKGSLSVKELIDHFQVSDMTIRRDLKELESSGSFHRFHGGIRYLKEEPLSKREETQLNEKKKIVEYCISILEEGDSIILDSGTTTYQLAIALTESSVSDLTIITHSLNIAFKLKHKKGIKLIMVGGEFREKSSSFIGNTTYQMYSDIFANKAFISAGGITEMGFSTANFSESTIKRLIIQNSEKSFLVADSKKFGYQSLSRFAPLNAVSNIITTKHLNKEWKEKPELKKIPIIYLE